MILEWLWATTLIAFGLFLTYIGFLHITPALKSTDIMGSSKDENIMLLMLVFGGTAMAVAISLVQEETYDPLHRLFMEILPQSGTAIHDTSANIFAVIGVMIPLILLIAFTCWLAHKTDLEKIFKVKS